MKFNSMTKEQIQNLNLMQPGIYNFQVTDALDQKSKNGNDTIKLILKVWDNDGKERVIFDYLVDVAAFHYKLRNFAETSGILDKYDYGNIDADDCKNKSGKLKIIIQKDKTGQYPDKNAVADYIMAKGIVIKPAETGADSSMPVEFDDDVPF